MVQGRRISDDAVDVGDDDDGDDDAVYPYDEWEESEEEMPRHAAGLNEERVLIDDIRAEEDYVDAIRDSSESRCMARDDHS